MLMKQYLREDFHFTPYNTICYLIRGERSHMLGVGNKFEINLIKNSKRKQEFETETNKNVSKLKKEKRDDSNSDAKSNQLKEITIADDDDDDNEEDDNVICLDSGENDYECDFTSKNKKIKSN
jgi:ATP-dependent DNA helicase Q1